MENIKVQKIDENLYELDARGLVCPFPEVLISRALENLASQETLEAIIDNPPSARDIPLSLEKKGFKVEVIRMDNLTWKIAVKPKSK